MMVTEKRLLAMGACLLALAGLCPSQAGAQTTAATADPTGKLVAKEAPAPGGTLPFPGNTPSIDPSRFGDKVPDEAFGAFQRGLYRTALNLALAEADKGNAAARTLAAEIYAQGLGTARNIKEAARLYGLAAEQGLPEAQFQTALLKLEGKHVAPDRDGAAVLLSKAADTGHVLATFNLAQLKLERASSDAEKQAVFELYLKAARAGLADAQYAVSQFLANGTGGVPFDEVAARGWMEKAARQNYDTAQLDLAIWMIEGIGGKRDYDAGFRWMKIAAERGTVEAMRQLAHLYENGIGTKGDMVTGAAWYVLAKRRGLHDPELDDLLDGLTDEETRKAIDLANRLR